MSKDGPRGSGKPGGGSSPARIETVSQSQQQRAPILAKGAVVNAGQRTQDMVRQEIASRSLRPKADLVGNAQPTPARIQGRVESMVREDLVRLYARNDASTRDAISERLKADDQYGRQLHRADPKVFQAVATDQARDAVRTHARLDGPSHHQLPMTDPYRAGKLSAEPSRSLVETKQSTEQAKQQKGRSI